MAENYPGQVTPKQIKLTRQVVKGILIFKDLAF
jgi:hypothetical protein